MRWRMIEIILPLAAIREIGWWRVLYGTDVFFNGVPLLKAGLVLWVLIRWGVC